MTLTTHDFVLLKLDDALRQVNPVSPLRERNGIRLDSLANSLDGLGGKPASAYAYALRELVKNDIVAGDTSIGWLSETGVERVRRIRLGLWGRWRERVVEQFPAAIAGAVASAPVGFLVGWLVAKTT